MKIVYLIQSIRFPQQRYRGVTEDVDRRLREHNAGSVVSTARFAPWRLVVAIRFEADARAIQLEKYLKSGSGHAFAERHFW